MAGTARLAIATHNAHKAREIVEILAGEIPALTDDEVVTAADVEAPAPVEDGVTFEDNARIKARALALHTGTVAIADDSGLCVDVLGGAPGVFSARWSGAHGDDRANLELLLAQLADVPADKRGAQFVCAAVAVAPDGREHVELGRVVGRLTTSPQGEQGFGYDPIFVAEGQSLTNGELDPEAKNVLSHRGQAFRALAPHLADLWAGN